MKKFALVFAILLTVVACDKGTTDAVKRNIGEALTNAAVPAVVTTLQCSNEAEVRNDIRAAVYGVLKVDEKSLASELCKSVFSTVMPQLLGTAINPGWGCTAENVQGTIKLVTDAACAKLQ